MYREVAVLLMENDDAVFELLRKDLEPTWIDCRPNPVGCKKYNNKLFNIVIFTFSLWFSYSLMCPVINQRGLYPRYSDMRTGPKKIHCRSASSVP